jgi:cation:H+ antiporter
MIINILLLVVGFVILIKGAGWLVDGSSALAKKYKVSDLAIGLTIVAFGTSMPEFVVNVFASINGHHDIVLGNIIGSNNFNIFVILGIAGLITPLIVQSSTVWKEIPLSLFAAMLLFILANEFNFSGTPVISRIDGLIFLMIFGLFILYVYKQLRSDDIPLSGQLKSWSAGKIWLFIIAGLAFLITGGRLVVTKAVLLAEELGISQTIVGLTIVAAGTSLPELATSIIAAIKRNNDIAVGNIIGSNIFNIFLVLGISSLLKPVNYNLKFNFDLYLLGIGTLILFISMFSGKKKMLDRWEAAVMLVLYIAYVIYTIYITG